jgi:hypothetical protein
MVVRVLYLLHIRLVICLLCTLWHTIRKQSKANLFKNYWREKFRNQVRKKNWHNHTNGYGFCQRNAKRAIEKPNKKRKKCECVRVVPYGSGCRQQNIICNMSSPFTSLWIVYSFAWFHFLYNRQPYSMNNLNFTIPKY